MPDSRYFELFNLEPALHLDLKDLEQRYFRLSRQWHPDLYARKSKSEQLQALDQTALLNDAYRTLRDPIKRAEYFTGHDETLSQPPPELLEEVFELNMAIEEGDKAELETYAAKFKAMLSETDENLFAPVLPAHGRERIRALLNRRKYIANLVRDVEKSLNA